MKSIRFAYITLAAVIIFVSLNTFILSKKIDELTLQVDRINGTESATDIEAIYDHFGEWETYFSLTVSHNDLTNTEEIFSEMIGCAKISDSGGIIVTKSRLCDALKHLRRLVGFNIDTIF